MSEEIPPIEPPKSKYKGRPKGSKNKYKRRTFVQPKFSIHGILLSDLNNIFKPNAIIPVDARLFDLLAVSPIDLSKIINAHPPEVEEENKKIEFEVVKFDGENQPTT